MSGVVVQLFEEKCMVVLVEEETSIEVEFENWAVPWSEFWGLGRIGDAVNKEMRNENQKKQKLCRRKNVEKQHFVNVLPAYSVLMHTSSTKVWDTHTFMIRVCWRLNDSWLQFILLRFALAFL